MWAWSCPSAVCCRRASSSSSRSEHPQHLPPASEAPPTAGRLCQPLQARWGPENPLSGGWYGPPVVVGRPVFLITRVLLSFQWDFERPPQPAAPVERPRPHLPHHPAGGRRDGGHHHPDPSPQVKCSSEFFSTPPQSPFETPYEAELPAARSFDPAPSTTEPFEPAAGHLVLDHGN